MLLFYKLRFYTGSFLIPAFQKILINENRTAYGVALTRLRFPQFAYASKEIVLSGGAFQTPLLLMKSGVGPVETLEEPNLRP